MSELERTTADGIVVRRGDTVWCWRGYGIPRPSKVTTSTLKVWSMWRLHVEAYASRENAMARARREHGRNLARAKRDAATARRNIARLDAMEQKP